MQALAITAPNSFSGEILLQKGVILGTQAGIDVA